MKLTEWDKAYVPTCSMRVVGGKRPLVIDDVNYVFRLFVTNLKKFYDLKNFLTFNIIVV